MFAMLPCNLHLLTYDSVAVKEANWDATVSPLVMNDWVQFSEDMQNEFKKCDRSNNRAGKYIPNGSCFIKKI